MRNEEDWWPCTPKERPVHLSGMRFRLCLEHAAPKEMLCRFQAAKSWRPEKYPNPDQRCYLGIPCLCQQDPEPKAESTAEVGLRQLNCKPQPSLTSHTGGKREKGLHPSTHQH